MAEISKGAGAKTIRSRLIHWVAAGFGAGYLPVAPGTAGSLVGAAIVFFLQPLSLPVYTAVLLATFFIGVLAADHVERAAGVKDAGIIVVDEIAGMMVVGFMIPAGLGYLAAGFFLFRVLDVWKPFPADWAERRLPGGWGVMVDDVVAGLYANLILRGAGALLLLS